MAPGKTTPLLTTEDTHPVSIAVTGLSVHRWLLLSGWLEICVGLGHNVLGSLIIVRPTLVTPVVAAMGLPMSLLTPIVPPEQNALVLALSLLAGTA